MTTKIWLAIDDEGMVGNLSEAEIEPIDIEATYARYFDAVIKQIKKIYPDAEIETSIGPTTYSVRVDSDELSAREQDDLHDLIQEIGGEVYGAGDFWMTKEG